MFSSPGFQLLFPSWHQSLPLPAVWVSGNGVRAIRNLPKMVVNIGLGLSSQALGNHQGSGALDRGMDVGEERGTHGSMLKVAAFLIAMLFFLPHMPRDSWHLLVAFPLFHPEVLGRIPWPHTTMTTKSTCILLYLRDWRDLDVPMPGTWLAR